MADTSSPEPVAPNGDATADPSVSDAVNQPTMADMMASFDGWKKKINGEMATLRRASKAREESVPVKTGDSPEPGAQGHSMDEVRAVIRLEQPGAIPDSIAERFGDRLSAESVVSRALMADIIAELSSDSSRGGMPDPKPTTRGQPSAQRSTASHPTTQSEFAKIKRTDPKRYKILRADPSFDASDLESV